MFEDFEKTSKKAWQENVETDLKGQPIESLYWQVEAHLSAEPFYHPDDFTTPGPHIAGQRSSNDWAIGETFDTLNLKEANAKAIAALSGGVNAPEFILGKTWSPDDFDELFAGINPAFISTHFILVSGASLPETFSNWVTWLNAQHVNMDELKGSFFKEGSKSTEEINGIFNQADQSLPHFTLFNSIALKNTAPSETLAELTTEASTFLGEMLATGVAVEDAARKVQFDISIGKDFFVEISRIRALRLLWANLLKAYDCNPAIPAIICARFNDSDLEKEETKNMIAAATMALSAVIGGVDRLYVTPAGHQNEAFTRRIARNVQHLLKMESFLDKVIDPAAGSYYIETLTRQLGEQAWKRFSGTTG